MQGLILKEFGLLHPSGQGLPRLPLHSVRLHQVPFLLEAKEAFHQGQTQLPARRVRLQAPEAQVQALL